MGLGSKSFSPRRGIAEVVVAVPVAERAVEEVVVVRAERKRKSWVSSERSASIGFAVPGRRSRVRWVCDEEGSSSSKSAMARMLRRVEEEKVREERRWVEGVGLSARVGALTRGLTVRKT